MKPVGIFGNNISKCPDIMRKRTPISLHRVPPVRSNKVKDYVSSVGSPCTTKLKFHILFYIQNQEKTGLNEFEIPFPAVHINIGKQKRKWN